jgi:hypothetical protein
MGNSLTPSYPKVLIDGKAVAFTLHPFESHITQFEITDYIQQKLRHYNYNSPHYIELTLTILSGKLHSAYLTKDTAEAIESPEASNLQRIYALKLDKAATNDFFPANYYFHCVNFEKPSKIMIHARVVAEFVDQTTGQTIIKVRSMTIIPDKIPNELKNRIKGAAANDDNNKTNNNNSNNNNGSDVPAAARLSTVARSTISVFSRGLAAGTKLSSHPILKIDDKATAVQIRPEGKEWIEFELTEYYQKKLMDYNAQGGSDHCILINFNVLRGKIAELLIYRTKKENLIESRNTIATEWSWRLDEKSSAGFKPASYFFKLSTGLEESKIICSAKIVQEVKNPNTGEISARHRAMTVMPRFFGTKDSENDTENVAIKVTASQESKSEAADSASPRGKARNRNVTVTWADEAANNNNKGSRDNNNNNNIDNSNEPAGRSAAASIHMPSEQSITLDSNISQSNSEVLETY